MERSDYNIHDEFLDVPTNGLTTITFKFGYVVFTNAENFVDENYNSIDSYYLIYEPETFKIQRNPRRRYDHSQIHYLFVPFMEKATASFVINFLTENGNVICNTRYVESDNLIVIVNPYNCSIRFTNYRMRIFEKDYIHYQDVKEIENVRYAVALPLSTLYPWNWNLEVYQYYKNPVYQEYKFQLIKADSLFKTNGESHTPMQSHDFDYPTIGQYFIRLTTENRTFDVEAGTSVSLYCDDFTGVVAIYKKGDFEKNLLKHGIMNIDYTVNGQLVLRYDGLYLSKCIYVYFFKKEANGCTDVIVHGTANWVFKNSQRYTEYNVQALNGKCRNVYVFFTYKHTRIHVANDGRILSDYRYLFGEKSPRYIRDVNDVFEDPGVIKLDPENANDESTFTINVDNPHSVEKSYIISENSAYKSVSSSELNKNENTPEKPVDPGDDSGKPSHESDKPTPEIKPNKPTPDNKPYEKPGDKPYKTKSVAPNDDKLNSGKTDNKKTVGIVVGVLAALIAIVVASIIGFIMYKRMHNERVKSCEVQPEEAKPEYEYDL